MANSARNRKKRVSRKLRLEQLETRRVFAGLVFDSLIYAAGGDLGSVFPQKSVADTHGNTYMAGHFTGQVDFDRSGTVHPGNADVVTARGRGDGFVAKYDPQNNLVWVRRFGGDSTASSLDDTVYDLAVDAAGSVYLAGNASSNADFGAFAPPHSGATDAFVAKVSPAGEFEWVNSWGSSAAEQASALAINEAGQVVVVGHSSGVTPNALFIRQYTNQGILTWSAEDFAASNSATLNSVKQAADGGYFVVGSFNGTIDTDPTAGVSLVEGAESGNSRYFNSFITKLSASGSFEWSQTYLATSSSSISIQDVTTASDGSLVAIGLYTGDVAIGVNSLPASGVPQAFLSRINATGQFLNLASKEWASASALRLTSVSEHLFVLLSFQETIKVDSNITLVSPAGERRYAMMEFSNQFETISAFATHPEYFYRKLASDHTGRVLITTFIDGSPTDYDPSINTKYSVNNPASNPTGATQGAVVKLRQKTPGSTVRLLDGDFEEGIQDEAWTQDSKNAWSRSLRRSTTGNYSAEFQGSASDATLTTRNVIDLTGLASATLSFDWLIESTFDSGEYLSLDISTDGGLSWISDVRRLNGNVSAENVWHSEVVDLAPYMTSETKARFRAKANRSDERASVDNVRIEGIVDGPNASPIANAGSGYVMNEGGSITLSAAGSSDPDGNIVSYAWDFNGDGIYDDASGMSPTFSTTVSGTRVIGLLVTDNRGATASTTTTVVVSNVAPTANAGGDLTGSIGQPITLSAAGSSDPGQDIVSYLWDLDNDGFYDDANGISAVFTSAVAGAFTVGLKVTDADGAVDFDSLTITITSAPVLSTKFYVVDDAGTDRTFEYSADGAAVESYGLASGNTAPRGAASTVAGDKVWVVDANKRVYVYNDSGVLLGSWSAGSLASNATVEGITTNGTDVWLVDARRDRVYRYAGAASRLSGSQSAASSFALNSGNLSPTDLVTDGTNIWVVNDNTTDRVFKYTMTGSLVGSWVIDSANSSPTGITLDPSGASQSIWIVDNGTDRVYEYTNARSRNSGSQAASASFALLSENGNPQGIADPPVPGDGQGTAPKIDEVQVDETSPNKKLTVVRQVVVSPRTDNGKRVFENDLAPISHPTNFTLLPSSAAKEELLHQTLWNDDSSFELPKKLSDSRPRSTTPKRGGESLQNSSLLKAVDDVFAAYDLNIGY